MTKAEDDLNALGEHERKAKISRTDTQAGIGASVLVLFCFVAAYFRLDLNPYEKGYQAGFPVVVEGAIFAVATALAVRAMNRRPKTDDPEAGQSDLRGLVALIVLVLIAVILGVVAWRLLTHEATGL